MKNPKLKKSYDILPIQLPSLPDSYGNLWASEKGDLSHTASVRVKSCHNIAVTSQALIMAHKQIENYYKQTTELSRTIKTPEEL